MGATRMLAGVNWNRIERLVLVALIAGFILRDVMLLIEVLALQPLGVDFLPLWTGARASAARLYDFAYVTARQSWLYSHGLRPFVYPPTALIVLKPFGAAPFWVAYPAFMIASGGLFLWAAGRLGAPRWFLPFPKPVVLVLLAGQLTFLIGGLVMAAMALKNRPWLCGVLFGLAGAVKPQMLVLLPFALAVAGDWRAFVSTGVTAAALGLISLGFGVSWIEWLQALPRFHDLVQADVGLAATSLTPYAYLGPLSYAFTVPLALAGVWFAFRTDRAPERVLALFGGALLVAPYATNYEIALLIPAVLAMRKSILWSLPFWLAILVFPSGPTSLVIAMALLFVSLASDRLGARGGLASAGAVR